MRTPWFKADFGTAFRTFLITGLLVGFFASGLVAQETNEVTPPAVPDLSKVQISINPFLLLGEYFAGEVEYAPGESVGFGLAFSHIGFIDDDDDDGAASGVNVLVRYYPGKQRLRGFYLGGRLGFYSVSDDGGANSSNDGGSSSAFGVELGYNWIFGESDGFYIGLGGGVTRLFDVDDQDAAAVIPIVRLVNVGWSF